MSSKKRIIDVEEWDAWYHEHIKNLNSYDIYDTGYEDALDAADDWMDAQPTGRAFVISEKEDQKISEWKQNHRLKHACSYGSCIGGEYSYAFSPTSIGTIGSVVCDRCGEEFVFRDL